MRILSILFFLFISMSGISQTTYELVWADEFDGNGAIDSDNWFHQTQLPAGGTWFNGEIQHYTNREVNANQSNGTLKIVAKKEEFTDQGVTKQYTSARLNSKVAFTYGRVEVRAKLPFGIGTWPAIWTLGKNIIEREDTGAILLELYFGPPAEKLISWNIGGKIKISFKVLCIPLQVLGEL